MNARLIYADLLVLAITLVACVPSLPTPWLQLPIPQATLSAFKQGTPITTSDQAIIAALTFLGQGQLQEVAPPKAINVEYMNYTEARKRIDDFGSSYDKRAPDSKVWLVQFEGLRRVVPPGSSPDSTPLPPRNIRMSVVVDASTGSAFLETDKAISQGIPYP